MHALHMPWHRSSEGPGLGRLGVVDTGLGRHAWITVPAPRQPQTEPRIPTDEPASGVVTSTPAPHRRLAIPTPDRLPVPGPTFQPARSEFVEAFVSFAPAGTGTRWWLAIGTAQPVETGWVEGEAVTAFDVVLRLVREQTSGLPLDLYSATPEMLRFAKEGEGIRVHSLARSHPRAHDLEVASQGTALDGAPLPGTCASRTARTRAGRAPVPARLIVAVDGSWGRATHIGGWGFLAADGRHRVGSGRVSSCGHAEVAAIRLAFLHLPKAVPLEIRSDSQDALGWITGVRGVPADVSGIVTSTRALMADRDIRFEWVRGHAGAGLHDGADRLSLAARRGREAHIGTNDEVVARIVGESLAAHRAGGTSDMMDATASRVQRIDVEPLPATAGAATSAEWDLVA